MAMKPPKTVAKFSEIELELEDDYNYLFFQRKDKKASPEDFSVILSVLDRLNGMSEHTCYRLEADDDVVLVVKFQHAIAEDMVMALFMSGIDEQFDYMAYGDFAAQ